MLKLKNGSKYYPKKILGYTFTVIELESGYISFGAPMGETKEDKQMFDDLVYYNKTLYNGNIKDKKQIVENIKGFIKKYEHKSNNS